MQLLYAGSLPECRSSSTDMAHFTSKSQIVQITTPILRRKACESTLCLLCQSTYCVHHGLPAHDDVDDGNSDDDDNNQ